MSGRSDKTILLVEDEALIALNEASTLQRHGFNVITVHSAERAVQSAASEERPDLILMDINLGPGKMDGTEAAEAILQFLDVPILFLSSHTDPETLKKTETISSYGYVAKMSGETALITSVNTAFKLHQAHLQLKQEKREKDFQAKLLGAVEQAVIVTDIDGTVTFWNPFAEKLYGWRKEEVLGRNIREFTVPEMSREEAELIMDNLSRGVSYAGEFLVQNKAGDRFYIHITNSPIVDQDGALTGIIGVSHDISDRKRGEEELQERVKELRCLYEFSELVENSDSIDAVLAGIAAILPPAYRYPEITCARITCRNRMYSSKSFTETEWRQAEPIKLHGETIGRVEVFYTEKMPECDEGPFLQEERTLIGMIAERLGKVAGRLEAEEVIAEQAEIIRKSEELHRITLQSIGDGVISTDNEGRIMTMNKAAQELTGHRAEDVFGQPLEEIFTITHGLTGEKAANPVKKVLETGDVVELANHTKLVSKTGDQYQIADTAAPILDDAGSTRGVVLVFRDETENYTRQKLLKESEERHKRLLEEKETLIREIHHRVKNNFNIISGLLRLQAETAGNEYAEAALTKARSRIDSMKKLYEHLFRSDLYTSINIGTYLNDLIQEIAGTYGGGSITIFSGMSDITKNVRTAVPLGIIINELVVNAIKYAFPDSSKGTVEIILEAAEHDRSVLTVRDDGKGLPPGFDLERAEGFGLNLVTGLVKQIDGTISLKREAGTEFTIKF